MRLLFLIILLLNVYLCEAQIMGFNPPAGKNKIEIPFTYQKNLILIKVILNDAFPLQFIFDTGSETSVLLQKEYADLLNIDYHEKIPLLGSDLSIELNAYLAKNIKLDLPNIQGNNLDLLVLEDDYFNFEKHLNIEVAGILGMNYFKTSIIKIDYKQQILTIYNSKEFKKPSKRYKQIPIDIYKGKPYLKVHTLFTKDVHSELNLLVDSGASLAVLLLNNSNENISLPTKWITGKVGNGLGGDIEGYIGKIPQLSFDDFYFNNVITSFQVVDTSALPFLLYPRNGLLGNEILSRFTIIVDVVHAYIYLKPQKKYNRSFQFDKSGLTVFASGKSLKKFIVKEVLPNSPASSAGIQIGDEIKRINFLSSRFYDLHGVTRKLQKRTGKKIVLHLHRNGKKQKVIFRLQELI